MKKVYGYIRVSTVKQGTGVSLQEQKESIIRYAEKHDLSILEWFEEKETAAKQGRTLFTRMMKFLQSGKAAGVIIHKIDRSARNLKDWAALGDLIDQGIEVHFAHESLDLDTRGGRLAADIQAVIASDYIRNLRDETKKGIYGRVKQGIYPLKAPVGYLNNGRGKLKTIDPLNGPLVRQAFQLYATGKYNLDSLRTVMGEYGLKKASNRVMSTSIMGHILNNPFYIGVIKIKGNTFPGNHEPLISPKVFNQVQDILKGKTNARILKHNLLFSRLIKCAECNYYLIGEVQKRHVYYRCHTKSCTQRPSIKEETVDRVIIHEIDKLSLNWLEIKVLFELMEETNMNWVSDKKGIEDSLKMREGLISDKLGRLTDAYIENAITKEQFEAKKGMLYAEKQSLIQKRSHISLEKDALFRKVNNFLELLKNLKNSYLIGINDEKRTIVKKITSNFSFHGKKPIFSMLSPFFEIANRPNLMKSCLPRSIPRICTEEFAESNNSELALVDKEKVRVQMKELFDWILKYFELQGNSDEEL